ncbi:tRNA modification GTPase MnmE [Trichinella pseudospiralis]
MGSLNSHACPFPLFREFFPKECFKIKLLNETPCRYCCSVKIGQEIYAGYGQSKQQAKHEMGLNVLISLFPMCTPLLNLSIFKRFNNCYDYPSKYRELVEQQGNDENVENYDEGYLLKLKQEMKFRHRILALTRNYWKKTPLQLFNEICDVARNVNSVEITYENNPSEVPEFNSPQCVCCKVVWNGSVIRGFGSSQKYAKIDAAQKALVKMFNMDPNMVVNMISDQLLHEASGLWPKEALIKICSLRAIKFSLEHSVGRMTKLVCGLDTFETAETNRHAITRLCEKALETLARAFQCQQLCFCRRCGGRKLKIVNNEIQSLSKLIYHSANEAAI